MFKVPPGALSAPLYRDGTGWNRSVYPVSINPKNTALLFALLHHPAFGRRPPAWQLNPGKQALSSATPSNPQTPTARWSGHHPLLDISHTTPAPRASVWIISHPSAVMLMELMKEPSPLVSMASLRAIRPPRIRQPEVRIHIWAQLPLRFSTVNTSIKMGPPARLFDLSARLFDDRFSAECCYMSCI